MKLLHIIASMNPSHGGPCQGIRNTNPELMHSGINREVVSLDPPDSPFLGTDDFEIHALGPAVGPWQYSAKLRPWLEANMTRFDVVIINGLWLYTSYVGWSVWSKLKKKSRKAGNMIRMPRLYVMPHGMLDPYFQRAPDRKLKAIRNWLYWKLIESKVVNNAEGLFFTSQAELELARNAFSPYHPKKELNVGYGILTPPVFNSVMQEAFFRKCPGVSNKPFILFFSRIHPKKGVDILIKAYLHLVKTSVANAMPVPKLVIAGPGLETAYGRRLAELVEKNTEIQNMVLFPGMLSGEAKWGALYSCDAFILPSHQENFGIAVVEALACGAPVLISNQVNIWKEINEGGAGLVENDDQEGTYSLLSKWVSLSPADKAHKRNNAVQVFNQQFNIARVASHFIKAIYGDN